MLIMACYFRKICGINQAEDRVTWHDLLHQRTRISGNDRLFPRGSEFGPNPKIPASTVIQLRPWPDHCTKCPCETVLTRFCSGTLDQIAFFSITFLNRSRISRLICTHSTLIQLCCVHLCLSDCETHLDSMTNMVPGPERNLTTSETAVHSFLQTLSTKPLKMKKIYG